jgi:H+/gluconate symporter-like permease
MEDSGSVTAIANFMTERLGAKRAALAVVLAGALVTYGGVSLFVAFFVIAPMAHALFRSAGIPKRLMPAAIMLGASTFTMSALPGTPAIQNAIPMPFFGTTPFAAPGLGIIASFIMLGFGLWWLSRAEARARSKGEGYGEDPALVEDAPPASHAAEDLIVRERTTDRKHIRSSRDRPQRTKREGTARRPCRVAADHCHRGQSCDVARPLAAPRCLLSRGRSLGCDLALRRRRRLGRRHRARGGDCCAGRHQFSPAAVAAGVDASALPVLSVASLVRDWVLGIEGGPLVSLALATNVLAALTGSASGGLTIALDSLGGAYMKIAAEQGIDPGLMHRVAVIGAGTLDMLPHNGAVVTVLAVCGATHRESYFDIVMVGIVSSLVALAVVIGLGTLFGSF